VHQAMDELIELFPIHVVANEALGLREKARKLKTPRKQLNLLRSALEIVKRGLTEHPSNTALQAAASELRLVISRVEAALSVTQRA